MTDTTSCITCNNPLRPNALFCVRRGTANATTAPAVTPATGAPTWMSSTATRKEPTVTVGSGKIVVPLASLEKRTAARAIDTAIISSVCGAMLLIGSITTAASTGPSAGSYYHYGYTGNSAPAGGGAMFAALVLALMFACAYEVVSVALWGRSVGKMAVGITIRDRRTGNKPSIGGAVLRWIAPGIGSLIPLLAPVGALVVYLSPVFDTTGMRQGWHDRLASTIVTLR